MSVDHDIDSVDRAYQAESIGRNSLVTILIAIRRSPNL